MRYWLARDESFTGALGPRQRSLEKQQCCAMPLSLRTRCVSLCMLGAVAWPPRLCSIRGADSTTHTMLKEPALSRTSYSGEIALAGSRRLRFTLAAAQVLFAHAAVTVAKN